MPRANIYIRTENQERWESIADKSNWVNNLLKDTANSTVLPTLEKRQVEKSAGFCKEGHPIPPGRDRCLGKGCKHA